jgi:DNA polymerase-3 subunit delta'
MEGILGQPKATAILQSALASDRTHHAWIFHGSEGVGKFTTATAFAKMLLCHSPQVDLAGNREACNGCESCKLINQPDAAHPDMHVVQKELAAQSSISTVRNRKLLSIPVDLIREFVIGGETSDGKFHDAAASKSPSLRHGKVFIIDEAHLLAAVGQNALLKTLEEPPPNTYFILVTHQLDQLLITIRSRCQAVSFGSLPDQVINSWLAEHELNLTERETQWFIHFCNGSLGLAEMTEKYQLVQWARDILPGVMDISRGKAAPMLGQDCGDKIDALAKDWVDTHNGASKEAANKMAANLMFHLLAQYARSRMQQIAETAQLDDPITNEQQLGPWLSLIDSLTIAQQALSSNVNLTLVMDHLFAHWQQSIRTQTFEPIRWQ